MQHRVAQSHRVCGGQRDALTGFAVPLFTHSPVPLLTHSPVPLSNHSPIPLFISVLLVLILVGSVQAQTTAFTYQGKLNNSGTPANGQYDFQFKVFDSTDFVTGSQVGSTITRVGVQVATGIFTVDLDFGPGVFDGSARFLEISVRPAGSPVAFTILSPRQPITSTPYALRSATAAAADNATNAVQLGGIAASQYVVSTDTRLTDARPPTPGSADYVQNTTSQQASTNFNISGDGTANVLNVRTQFNLAGFRFLSNAGTNNLFAGIDAGAGNTTGNANSFFGKSSGQTNTSGASNSFVGYNAGAGNTTGSQNSFFGDAAGFRNAGANANSFFGFLTGFHNTGSENSFFGNLAGAENTTGWLNSFFGAGAGQNNTTGTNNSFFGQAAGFNNLSGISNSFFGVGAGNNTTTGDGNIFVGASSGLGNTTGSNNTLVGTVSNVGANNLSFATAIGAGAVVNTSNTVVLGRSVDTVQIAGTLNANTLNTPTLNASTLNVTGTFAAGTVNATTQFNLNGSRILSNAGTSNLFAGVNAGSANNSGTYNSFFGRNAGQANTSGGNNAFFGAQAGESSTTGGSNSFFGAFAGKSTTTNGSNAFFGTSAGAANTACCNAFFGSGAGTSNTTGGSNSFFGGSAGGNNTAGFNNSFFGSWTGLQNVGGVANSFFGVDAGTNNTGGNYNTSVGISSGFATINPTGNENTTIGAYAVVNGGLTNATAIGARAYAIQNNTIVLGSVGGIGPGLADTNVGIGTVNPSQRLHVVGTTGLVGNVGVGTANPLRSLQIGPGIDSLFTLSESDGTPHAGAIRFGDNTGWKLYIGRNREFSGGGLNFGSTGAVMTIQDNGRVGIGTTSPDQLLSVNGNASKAGGGSWATFSDERLKNIRGSFNAGLKAVMQLQPIRYEYKRDNVLGLRSNEEHVGLAAQAVERVIPEAVTKSEHGYLLVNNDPIMWTMLNAIKEQQQQIEAQEQQIRSLRQQVEALRKLVCQSKSQADLCRETNRR